MSLLDIDDLEVYYGKSKVVDGVTFSVDENEVMGLLGPNGAGKTSILDSIFNYTDWSGEIRFEDEDLSDLTASEIATLGVGYCMEEKNLFPYMSVRENLLMGAYNRRETLQENLDDVFELFPKLEERQDQDAVTLSGGEQQMLAIGKVLMNDPKLLIFDEPTLGLAPIVIENISTSLVSLREDFTILLVEQNATFAFEHADEIVLMETGTVVARGHPDELEDDEYVQRAYLGL